MTRVFRLGLALFVAGLLVAAAYLDGPPVASTGGFGEPVCNSCHFGAALNEASGSLHLDGLPERLPADSTVRLSLQLAAPDLVVGGFQLSIRDAGGNNVGSLSPTDINTQRVESDESVQYLQHTRHGVENAVASNGNAVWQFEWATPPKIPDSILIHIAANAANGDNSALGDYIYTKEIVLALPPTD